MSGVFRLVKRVTDVLFSSLLLLLLSPLMGVLAVAIRLDSPGPALFLSERVGKSGRVFRMAKFRSMVNGAHFNYEDLRQAKPEAVNGVLYKDADDHRITRFGRFLRISSLDELPQLWNVLMGDMSLVGPRPLHTVEIDQMDKQAQERLTVKPGLTGLWQVSGRSLLPFEKAIELDLYYVHHASIWLDLTILAKTIPAVLSRKGAF